MAWQVASTPLADLLRDFAGEAMPEVQMQPDDHATIMYTSGSTGHPKGALSSHRGILSALYSWMLMGRPPKWLREMQRTKGTVFPPRGC